MVIGGPSTRRPSSQVTVLTGVRVTVPFTSMVATRVRSSRCSGGNQTAPSGSTIQRKVSATCGSTSGGGRLADKQFHAALLRATCNPFIISLTNSVTAAVQALTEFKIRGAALKRDPVPDHVRVYEAIAAKDAERARAEMSELIRLAILDTPMKQRPKHSASSRFLVD